MHFSRAFWALFQQYALTLVLLLAISTLMWQGFVINHFPQILDEKARLIAKNIAKNRALESKNQALAIELKMKSEADMEVLESLARYRFGLIKADEHYYQIGETPR